MHTEDVDVDNLKHLLIGPCIEESEPADAGVVDQAIQPKPPARDRSEGFLDLVGLGHVHWIGMTFSICSKRSKSPAFRAVA
jgi:hypothetical protein